MSWTKRHQKILKQIQNWSESDRSTCFYRRNSEQREPFEDTSSDRETEWAFQATLKKKKYIYFFFLISSSLQQFAFFFVIKTKLNKKKKNLEVVNGKIRRSCRLETFFPANTDTDFIIIIIILIKGYICAQTKAAALNWGKHIQLLLIFVPHSLCTHTHTHKYHEPPVAC